MTDKECWKCHLKLEELVDGMTFNFLEGEPSICSKCLAESLGIFAHWKKEIVDFIQRKINA